MKWRSSSCMQCKWALHMRSYEISTRWSEPRVEAGISGARVVINLKLKNVF